MQSAEQLAELMAAVGLAQNFAALRALVSSGIQKGHMRMHARSVASVSSVRPRSAWTSVVEQLVVSGEVKEWKAAEILATLNEVAADGDAVTATAAGKSHPAGRTRGGLRPHRCSLFRFPNAVRAAVANAI